MKTMHIGKAVINFFQKGIVLSLLIFVGLTARANPSRTEVPYSKGKVSSSTDCAYALSPARAEVTAEASNGEVAVTVTTDAGCPWTTDSNDLWITITSATSGTGPGTVTYSYKANMSDQERTGTLMIGGQTYTVRQAGRPLIADGYEPNDTRETAPLLPANFPPNPALGTSVSIDISPATCHTIRDADYYKIELGTAQAYTYTIVCHLYYNGANQIDHNNYTLYAKMSYSTNGVDWRIPNNIRLSRTTVSGGTFYLKIEPYNTQCKGTYAAKIDITLGCHGILSASSKQVTGEEGTGEVTVTTGSACTAATWTAVSNVPWIRVTSGANVDGNRTTRYSYDANTSPSPRTGTITIADQTYTVTQAPRPIPPDGNEPNNTVAQASLLPLPVFVENASVINIASVNCHTTEDVDIYKINLGTEKTYTISGDLYGSNNQQTNNSNYTLHAKISYSTNGVVWSAWYERRLPPANVPGGTFYLKIQPYSGGNLGTYAAKIDITRGCDFFLSALRKEAEGGEGTGEVTVTTGSTCSWSAAPDNNASSWITITEGASGTGTGTVKYSYSENTSLTPKEGNITIAGQTYSVTQARLQLLPDANEPNNTKESAHSLEANFANENASIHISEVNCHLSSDVDIYKINLGTEKTYAISGELYGSNNQNGNSNYTLRAKISYSTNGADWSAWYERRLPPANVPGGTLYLKVEPYNTNYSENAGAYAARIDITRGCHASLPVLSKQAAGEADTGEITVTTGSSCASSSWTAVSLASWIRLASGGRGTGSGTAVYSYEANTDGRARNGTIAIAGQIYTVNQTPRPMAPDDYEPNNTAEQATPIAPEFTENASVVHISSVNCHDRNDADIYKIELGSEYTYAINGTLYDLYNQVGDNYTLDAKMSYSTDNGISWRHSYSHSSTMTVQGGFFYLKIEADNRGDVGTYAAKIEIRRLTTEGCSYGLPDTEKYLTAEAGAAQVQVWAEGGSTCAWTAVSRDSWITITEGASRTGTGALGYRYTENSSLSPRTGTITIADQTYAVTQLPRPLAPDGYEANNTVAQAHSLRAEFVENASVIHISPANRHDPEDVDIYKINLASGYTYAIRGELYYRDYRTNNNYTLNDAKISYSTDGANWLSPPWENRNRVSLPTVSGGDFYLRIEAFGWNVGAYAAKVDIRRLTAAGCTYTLTETSKDATKEAGTAQAQVTTRGGSACIRTAFSNELWITITEGASGEGDGTVSYSYDANTGAEARTGTITIADKTYTVRQAGRPILPDSYEPNNTVAEAVSPASRSSFTPTFSEGGSVVFISPATLHHAADADIYKINLGPDSYAVSVTLRNLENGYGAVYARILYSTDGIAWRDPQNMPTVSGGTLYVKIEPVAAPGWQAGTYAATIDIKTKTTAGCTYALSPVGKEATPSVGTGRITVAVGELCAWTAVSNDRWIRLVSGHRGTGNGKVDYYYEENGYVSPRTGTITVADQIYTVTQDGQARSFSPDGYEPNNTAEDVQTNSRSSLTPIFTQNVSTLSISPANCHEANDVDIYKINLGNRFSSYTVGGVLYAQSEHSKDYTLRGEISYSTNGTVWSTPEDSRTFLLTTQGGALYLRIKPEYPNFQHLGSYAVKIDITGGCTYSLPVTSKEVAAEAGFGEVSVTATASANGITCPWTAASNVEWITLISAQGTGAGNISYSYAENITGFSRTGAITAAGQTYTVTQQAGRRPLLEADAYEPNNTVQEAQLRSSFTPTFTQNTSLISIAPANLHNAGDVDIYKINLGTGFNSYTVGGTLYGRRNQNNNSRYTLNAKISYSTGDAPLTWRDWGEDRRGPLPNLSLLGGTLYLKVEPSSPLQGARTGSYELRLDITGGCTYSLRTNSRQLTSEAGHGQITVETGSSDNVSCPWTAVSNAEWITIAQGSKTGSGSVSYSYTENTETHAREGEITVAGQTYTVTQAPRLLSPDGYEPNNTAAGVSQASTFTPTFTGNASRISISPANCHEVHDVDIYKIELGADPCAVSVTLYDATGIIPNGNYTLDVKVSYSTDGAVWSDAKDSQLSLTGQGTLYLKIEPSSLETSFLGSYAARIDILKATSCTYALSAISKQAAKEAASDQTIEVITGESCAWTATSNVPWITIASDQIRTSRGNVVYSYAENMAPSSRTGTITIADKTYTVRQAGRPLLPDGYEENNTVDAVAPASTFTPTFTGNESVISISSANCHNANDEDIYKINLGAGNSYAVSVTLYDWLNPINNSNYTLWGAILYSADGITWSQKTRKLTNLAAREGTLYIKITPYRGHERRTGFYSLKIDITAAACAYSLSKSSAEAPANASEGTFDVTTGPACSWRSSSNAADWITLRPSLGTGNTTVTYSIIANTGVARNGIVTIGGQTFTVTQQAPASCTYSLSKSSAEVPGNASEGTFDVTTGPACSWEAVSDAADWITLRPASGIGNTTVTYSVAQTAGAERTGTITIGGQTFTVTQQAPASCTYSLSKSSAEVPGNASEGTFDVTTGPACSWEAVSNAADWITLRPASGTGNTTVTYSVAQTAGAERTGTITIGRQTFTVKQSAVTGFETVSPAKIYPNPAKDFVIIDLSGSGVKYASLKIANQFGQVIYEMEHPGHAVKIPLKGFASGLYFIFLQGDEKTAVQKLIVND